MKTVEQFIFEKRFNDAEFDPNDYNDWAKENEYEAYTLCLAVAKQQHHLVMQAGSDGAKGAAVGQRSVGTVAEDGDFSCWMSLGGGEQCKELCAECSGELRKLK